MTTTLDRDLLDAASDATQAIADGATLTDSARLRAALVLLVNRTETARDDLAAAVRAAEVDTSENRCASLAFDEAVKRGVAVYRNLQALARPRLVDLDPDHAAELGAGEVQARQDFFASAFAMPPSDFARIGRVAVRGRLHESLDRMATRSDYVPDSERQRLADAVARIDAAHDAVRNEQTDDAPLFERLVAARDETGRQTRALRTLAEAVLLSDRSPLSLDGLLQQARRRRSPAPIDAPQRDEDAATPADADPQPAPTEPEPA